MPNGMHLAKGTGLDEWGASAGSFRSPAGRSGPASAAACCLQADTCETSNGYPLLDEVMLPDF